MNAFHNEPKQFSRWTEACNWNSKYVDEHTSKGIVYCYTTISQVQRYIVRIPFYNKYLRFASELVEKMSKTSRSVR